MHSTTTTSTLEEIDGFPETQLRKSHKEKSLKKKMLSKKRMTKFFKRLSSVSPMTTPRDNSSQNVPYLLQVEHITHRETAGAEQSAGTDLCRNISNVSDITLKADCTDDTKDINYGEDYLEAEIVMDSINRKAKPIN